MTQVNNPRQDEYNKFEMFPDIAYNCVATLVEKEDILWKLLKYSSPDALSQPNLTKEEKGVLIYDGSPNETDFNVFLSSGQDNSWTRETCILCVSPQVLIPTNHIYGNISISFEIYAHYKINHLKTYQTRTDLAAQRIISTMNGAEINGLGRIFFDARASRYTKSFVGGSIPYKSRIVIMCNWIT